MRLGGSKLRQGPPSTTDLVACFSVNLGVYCSVAHFTGRALTSLVPAASAAPVKLGTGRNPTAAFPLVTNVNCNSSGGGGGAQEEQQTPFMVRYGSSFCFNTQLIDDNTGIFFGEHACDLRDWPAVQAVASPMQGYVFARDLRTLVARIGEGNRHLHGFASTCDAELFHGVFDSGNDAGVPLLLPASPVYDADVAAGDFVAVVPLTSLLIGTISSCGSSAPGGAMIRLEAFPLPGMRCNYSAKP